MVTDFEFDVNGKTISYSGNSNLKPCKCVLEYTKEHVEEIIRCKNNWKYFAQTYYHITSLDEGIIKVKTRFYQDNIINNFINNRFNIVLASRQCGKSTSYEIFCLWYILFNEAKTVAILANKLDTSVGILAKIKMAYELLPKFLQQGIKKWNERSIELENGCKILASATSSSAIRSKSVNVLILDEMGFVFPKQWSKFYSSVYPTISSSLESKIIIVSTPNGLNQFYKFWTDAINGKDDVAGKGNMFVPYRVDWWEVPGRDQKWKEETIANTSEREFASEFGNDFLGSSRTLIESHILNMITQFPPIYPMGLKIDSRYLPFIKVYDNPIPGHIYSLGLDSSEMMEETVGDAIALQVLDITTTPYVQAATCHIKEGITYFEVPEIAVQLGKYYNNAYMFIEANSTGLEIANLIVDDFEYENVYYGQKSPLPGIKTTAKTKRIGCSNLKMLVEGQHLILKDSDTISQLTTFTKKKKSYGGDSGYLDDAVMALIVSLYFINDKQSVDGIVPADFVIKTFQEHKDNDGTSVIINPDSCGDAVLDEMERAKESMKDFMWMFNK
jgi:hypothetical protein